MLKLLVYALGGAALLWPPIWLLSKEKGGLALKLFMAAIPGLWGWGIPLLIDLVVGAGDCKKVHVCKIMGVDMSSLIQSLAGIETISMIVGSLTSAIMILFVLAAEKKD